MINEKIEKEGDKWVVKSESGDTLGTHGTKEDAVDQLKAIEANKTKNEVIKKPELNPSSYDPEVLQKAIDDAKAHTRDYESAFNMAIHNLATNPSYREKIKKYLSKKISEKEELKGGLADGADPSNFDADQVIKGIKVEFEHTNDFDKAVEITLDHLVEDPKYYNKLAKIEPHHDIDEMSAAGGGAVAGAAGNKSNIDKDNPWYKERIYSLEESVNYFVDDFLKKKLNENRGYKDYDKNMSISDVGKMWAKENIKLYDPKRREYHGIFHPKDVFPYKEFTRDVKNKHALRKKLLKNGWDKSKPAMIMVGKNGKVCLREGNHRLKIVEELKSMTGKKFQIPVRFFFYKNVDCGISVLDKDHDYDERWKSTTTQKISRDANKKTRDRDIEALKSIFGINENRQLNEVSAEAAQFVLDKLEIEKNTMPNELFGGEDPQRKIIRLPAKIHPQMENIIGFFENNDYNLNMADGTVSREYKRIIPAGPKKGETELKKETKKIGKALNGLVSYVNKIIDPFKKASFRRIKKYMRNGYRADEAQARTLRVFDRISSKDIDRHPLLEKTINNLKDMGETYPSILIDESWGSSIGYWMRNFFDQLGFDVGFHTIFSKLQRYQNKINEWPTFWNKKSKDYINNPESIYEENEQVLIASRHPMDVLRMSDVEQFDNCHAEARKTGDKKGSEGIFFECAVQEAINGGAVVFSMDIHDFRDRVESVFNENNLETVEEALNHRELFFDPQRPEDSGPFEFDANSRLRLRKVKAYGPDGDFIFMAPEPRIYGVQMTILYETLKDYAFKHQEELFEGKDLAKYKFKTLGGSWEDTHTRKLLVGFFKNTKLDGEWLEDADFKFRDDRSEPEEKEYIFKHSKSIKKYGDIFSTKLAEIVQDSKIKAHYGVYVDESNTPATFGQHNDTIGIKLLFKNKDGDLMTFKEGSKYLKENNLLQPTLRRLENMYLKNLGFRFQNAPISQLSNRFGMIYLDYKPLEEQNKNYQDVTMENFKGALEMLEDSIVKLKEDLDEFFESAQYILEEEGSEVIIA